MFHVILTIHILLCICLVFLVLIQQGKGADMGAAFGGGSNTVFGASGAPDFLTKLTTGMAIAFMVTSILLVRSYSKLAHEGVRSDPLAGSVFEGATRSEPAAPVQAVQPDRAAPVDAGDAEESQATEPAAAAPAAEQAVTDESKAPAEAPATEQSAPADSKAPEANEAASSQESGSSAGGEPEASTAPSN